MAAQSLEISRVIDGRKVSGYQWFIIAMCAAIVFLDGFDAQAIGYVGPALIKDWHLTRPQLGPVVSMGLFGLMLGALFVAPLADRLGRRPMIIASTIMFGVFTLATAFAQDLNHLLILRFLTGLGLGGCMPNAIALTAEYAPNRQRSLLVMIMFNGFTLGSLSGGLISAQLVPEFGWRAVFLVGGLLPLVLAPLFFFLAPESLRFLVKNKAPGAKIARIVHRLDPTVDAGPDTIYVIAEEQAKKMSVKELLTDGRARRTLFLWVIFFMSLLDVYMLVSWLPTLMDAVGAPARTAILMGVILQFGGFAGSFPLGYLIDRFGSRAIMMPSYLLGAAAIAGIGLFATQSIPLTFLVVFLAGFGVIGGQTAANAVAAESYPTEIRSTGVGWALGIGRIGSIVGPLVASYLLVLHVTPRDIFYISAVPAVVAALAVIGLGKPPKRLTAAEAAVVAH
jgi:AAHS family 4-hydroxybenzoate transporter-like MFS transporter